MNHSRVIFLGFDAAVLPLIDHFIDDLPNFRCLMKAGFVSEARGSLPLDTPTNWTTIATGAYTSTHGVCGFYNMTGSEPLKEIVRTFGSSENRAEYVWQALERQGKRCILVNYPTAFPITIGDGGIVAGTDLAAPDLWELFPPELYSTGADASRPIEWLSPGRAQISFSADNKVEQTANGPVVVDSASCEDDYIIVNDRKPPEAIVKLSRIGSIFYQLTVESERVVVTRPDGSKLTELACGKWSGPIYDTFPTEAGEKEAFFFMKLMELSQDGKTIRIARSAVHLTRETCHPQSIADELRERNALLMHHAFPHGTSDPSDPASEEFFELKLELISQQIDNIADTTRYLANKYPWDLLMVQIHLPDNVQHAMAPYLSPHAEALAPPEAIARAHRFIALAYRQMDRLLGRIMTECKGEGDSLILAGDHGFVPTWRGYSLTGILVDAGYSVYEKRPSGRYVIEWDKSVLYQGIVANHLFLNLKGREPFGIVEPEEYDRLRAEIVTMLQSVRDPETGRKVFAAVLSKEETGQFGLFGPKAPDIVVLAQPCYFDQTAQGNFFPARKWDEWIAGGRCFRSLLGCGHGGFLPDMKEGIMSTNAVFMATGPNIKADKRMEKSIHLIDIAPTICRLLGCEPPENADGQVLSVLFDQDLS